MKYVSILYMIMIYYGFWRGTHRQPFSWCSWGPSSASWSGKNQALPDPVAQHDPGINTFVVGWNVWKEDVLCLTLHRSCLTSIRNQSPGQSTLAKSLWGHTSHWEMCSMQSMGSIEHSVVGWSSDPRAMWNWKRMRFMITINTSKTCWISNLVDMLISWIYGLGHLYHKRYLHGVNLVLLFDLHHSGC